MHINKERNTKVMKVHLHWNTKEIYTNKGIQLRIFLTSQVYNKLHKMLKSHSGQWFTSIWHFMIFISRWKVEANSVKPIQQVFDFFSRFAAVIAVEVCKVEIVQLDLPILKSQFV